MLPDFTAWKYFLFLCRVFSFISRAWNIFSAVVFVINALEHVKSIVIRNCWVIIEFQSSDVLATAVAVGWCCSETMMQLIMKPWCSLLIKDNGIIQTSDNYSLNAIRKPWQIIVRDCTAAQSLLIRNCASYILDETCVCSFPQLMNSMFHYNDLKLQLRLCQRSWFFSRTKSNEEVNVMTLDTLAWGIRNIIVIVIDLTLTQI